MATEQAHNMTYTPGGMSCSCGWSGDGPHVFTMTAGTGGSQPAAPTQAQTRHLRVVKDDDGGKGADET